MSRPSKSYQDTTKPITRQLVGVRLRKMRSLFADIIEEFEDRSDQAVMLKLSGIEERIALVRNDLRLLGDGFSG